MELVDELQDISEQHQALDSLSPQVWRTYDKAVELDQTLKEKYPLEFSTDSSETKEEADGQETKYQKDSGPKETEEQTSSGRGRKQKAKKQTPQKTEGSKREYYGVSSSKESGGNKLSRYTCPNCGSNSVQKLSVFHQQSSSNGGCGGCTGCLLFMIILILAPGIVLLGGLATGATMYALRGPLMIGVIISFVLAIIVKIYRENTYICERCGTKFRP